MNDVIKWWNKYSMFCHIGAWVMIAMFMGGGYFSEWKAQAATISNHESRIASLENAYARTGQEIDDLVDYLHVPHKNSP
jgi:hypothetical protein